MINFLKGLFAQKKTSKDAVLQPEALIIVSFDSDEIQCQRPGGKEEKVKWNDLRAVVIETTDEGPMLPDFFWLLLGENMESGCVIPQGATGEKELMEEMQQRLKGFDNEMLISAMTSTDNQKFLIWKKENS